MQIDVLYTYAQVLENEPYFARACLMEQKLMAGQALRRLIEDFAHCKLMSNTHVFKYLRMNLTLPKLT